MGSRFLLMTALLVLICAFGTAHSDDFSILFVSPNTDSLSNQTYALVAGGYVDGLEKGMQGDVLNISKDDDTIVIGRGLLADVSRFESSCLVRWTGEQLVDIGDRVILQPLEPDKAKCVEEGKAAFDASDFERAHFFLSRALKNASPEDSAAFIPLTEKSMTAITKWLDSTPNKKEKEREESKAPAYLALAQHYLADGHCGPAMYYFQRFLRVYPKHQVVNRILNALIELFEADAEKTGQEILAAEGHSPDDKNVEIYPKMTKTMIPEYPQYACQVKLTGVVWVKALVSRTGRVLRAMVGKSSGHLILDNAAVAAAYGNEFKPGIQGGKAVNCWVTYEVNFEL